MRPVGFEQALTIGRPTNFVSLGGVLCIFGNRYNCVRTWILCGLRKFYVSWSICLFSYIHVTVSYTFSTVWAVSSWEFLCSICHFAAVCYICSCNLCSLWWRFLFLCQMVWLLTLCFWYCSDRYTFCAWHVFPRFCELNFHQCHFDGFQIVF